MARLCLSAIRALRKFMLLSCSSPDRSAIRSSLVCLRKEICRHPCPDEYHEPTHPSLWQPQGVMGAEVSTDDCPQNHDRGMRPKDSPSHNEDEHGDCCAAEQAGCDQRNHYAPGHVQPIAVCTAAGGYARPKGQRIGCIRWNWRNTGEKQRGK